MKKWLFIPVGLFLAVALFLLRGLSLDPKVLPSARLNQAVPVFSLPELNSQQQINESIFQHHWVILSVWASWCAACTDEHPYLMTLSKQHIPLIGLSYKDDSVKAQQWLNNYGNPYQSVIMDADGSLAIDLGVYGSPETFLIERNGIIRYRHVGVLTEKIWQEQFRPLIKKLPLGRQNG